MVYHFDHEYLLATYQISEPQLGWDVINLIYISGSERRFYSWPNDTV